jgi:hypothetical protein
MRFVKLGSMLLVAVLALAAWCKAAQPAPTAKAAPAPTKELTVHEWGTFSTFSGSDGVNLTFQPYDNDLPDFVHGYLQRNSKAGPEGGTISLETPVIYFYSEKALTASVQVDFPKGIMTEWFPQATRTDHRLSWPEIKVLPKDETNLLEEKKPSRYYAARETDATPLRVAVSPKADGEPPAQNLPVGTWTIEFANGSVVTCEIKKDNTASVVELRRTASGKVAVKDGSFVIAYDDDRLERWTPVGKRMVVEHWYPSSQVPVVTPVLGIATEKEKRKDFEQDKFLFYRGVGTFDMPLSVKAAAGGKFTVNWTGQPPEGHLILVQVKAGKIRFQQFGLEKKDKGATAAVKVPGVDATTKELGDALVKLLTAKGLYEKEAKAMVKTWSSAWFGEEGTRVLYILPTDLTDELLPLKVDPRPAELKRVLVGRHDVLTPERETQIDAWTFNLNGANPATEDARRVASEEMAKLGRYQWAAQQAAVKRQGNRR